MKKVTGMILVVAMLGAVLAGCYSKSCDQPVPQPMNYKGEVK